MQEYAGDIYMLIDKHLKNVLSDDEKKRLEDWVNASPANKKVFEELTQGESLNAAFADYSSIVNEHRARLTKRNTKKVVKMYATSSPRRIYIAVAASVAAAVLLLFTVRTFYHENSDRRKNEVASSTKPSTLAYEIPPAGNQATLTLSSGQLISLNDIGNGQIAQDGKTVINKRQDGELIYNVSGGSTATSGFNSVITPRGGKYQVVLPDGSKVWLNAATALRFPISFPGNERVVELAGEAYFEISKDKARPFKVMMAAAVGAGNRQYIEVLGTHFNVGAYPDEPQVTATLLEGSIRFTSNETATLLKPGEQALLTKGKGGVKITHPEDPQNNIAWVNGKFAFSKTPVATVMRELSRWYDIQILYEGNAAPTTLFTGEVDRMIPLSKLLSYLEQMGSTRFTVEGKTVKVKA